MQYPLQRGADRDELSANRQLVMAVVKCVEIIGEAANQVSEEGRSRIPSLPWRDIIAMRHRLVHVYYDVNLAVVWSTVQVDLPPLIKMLEAVEGLED